METEGSFPHSQETAIIIIKKRFTVQKVYAVCTWTNYKIVPLTNLNKHLRYDTSEPEVNVNISVNNGSEKSYKKPAS